MLGVCECVRGSEGGKREREREKEREREREGGVGREVEGYMPV